MDLNGFGFLPQRKEVFYCCCSRECTEMGACVRAHINRDESVLFTSRYNFLFLMCHVMVAYEVH